MLLFLTFNIDLMTNPRSICYLQLAIEKISVYIGLQLTSEDCLSSWLLIRTIKNIGHRLRFQAIVMFHTCPPDSFLLCLSIFFWGGCSTRISRSPRISRTRYPRGTLHADISHPADISHFFCYEISAGDLARGYLVTSDCNLHPLY